MPRKKELTSVWPVVRKHLGLDPSSLEDNDLRKVSLASLTCAVSSKFAGLTFPIVEWRRIRL